MNAPHDPASVGAVKAQSAHFDEPLSLKGGSTLPSYDLAYDEVGVALGSTETAARQAASAGVRRLRKEQQ